MLVLRVRAAIIGLLYVVGPDALHSFVLCMPGVIFTGETFYQHIGFSRLHYIDVMLLVLVSSVMVGLGTNRLLFGNQARYIGPGACVQRVSV